MGEAEHRGVRERGSRSTLATEHCMARHTEELEATLDEQLARAQAFAEGLDPGVIAHRLARYKLTQAMECVYAFVASGRRRDLRLAEETLARAGETLGEHHREELRNVAAALLDTATELVGVLAREETHSVYELKDRQQAAATIDLDADVGLILRIMRNLAHGLKRWTWETASSSRGRPGMCWQIENEQHVQNLLWLALAPAVSGLRSEVYLPSVGHSQPRADFALPASGLAIEVKFIRRQKAFDQVRQELLADSRLYLSGDVTPYTQLIAFVWDDTRSTELHAGFMEGLKQTEALLDVIVVSRPGAISSPERRTAKPVGNRR
jgi:hypothetical protein